MWPRKIAENTAESLHGSEAIWMHIASKWFQAYKTDHDEEEEAKRSKSSNQHVQLPGSFLRHLRKDRT